MKLWTLVVFAWGLAASAPARIGENQTQMSARYGVPREDRKLTAPSATVQLNCTKTYDTQGWKLTAEFVNNQVVTLEYFRGGPPYGLQPNEIQSVLTAEANGGRWTKVKESLWSNSNGTAAEAIGNQMTIKSGATLRREDAERNRKPARPTPAF